MLNLELEFLNTTMSNDTSSKYIVEYTVCNIEAFHAHPEVHERGMERKS